MNRSGNAAETFLRGHFGHQLHHLQGSGNRYFAIVPEEVARNGKLEKIRGKGIQVQNTQRMIGLNLLVTRRFKPSRRRT